MHLSQLVGYHLFRSKLVEVAFVLVSGLDCLAEKCRVKADFDG